MKRHFLESQLLLGAILIRDRALSKSEKWTIFIALVMMSLFVTGLFYDADRNSDDEKLEDVEDFLETAAKFGWTDALIILYSAIIILPVAPILKFLFTRPAVKKTSNFEEILNKIRFVRVKRIIGYVLAGLIIAAASWSCIAFSLSFGFNTTNQWIFSFSIAQILDIVITQNVSALVVSLILFRCSVLELQKSKSIVREFKRINTLNLASSGSPSGFSKSDESPKAGSKSDGSPSGSSKSDDKSDSHDQSTSREHRTYQIDSQ